MTQAQQPPAEDGSRPYDVDYPDAFKELMRQGWADVPQPVQRSPWADQHASRRAALAAAFPGEHLVIPTGRDKVRNNDAFYPFRPGSDFVWLTGEHGTGSVLLVDPDGGATLYLRPHTTRDTDEFYRNAAFGELWVGRRRSLAETTEELGVRSANLADLPAALARLAPATTRVLRGMDAGVDAQIRP